MNEKIFRILFLLLVVCVIVGTRIFFVANAPEVDVPEAKEETAEIVDEAVSTAPIPQVTSSKFLNTTSEAHYVGSDKCVDCHADWNHSYHRTRHSRSLSVVDNVERFEDAKFFHSASNAHYATFVDDGKLVHSESIQLGNRQVESQRANVSYVVGSGAFGHSFLTMLDGFLVQSPLTWYAPRDEWGMSPGYDDPNQFSFRRSVSAGCLYCHSGIVDVENENLFEVKIQELAIGCERCHGPGSMHVDFHTSGKILSDGQIDNTIVNPEHLPRELEEAVCQQCHLQGDAKVLIRGRELDSYRPGLHLDEFRQNYRVHAVEGMTIVGHVEQMHSSECYQQSETLTCITCHDMHTHMEKAELMIHYRSVCLDCHDSESCGEEVNVRKQANNDQCVKCHMPSSPTEVPHVAFTHHRIGIHRESGKELRAEENAEDQQQTLIAMLDESKVPEADVHRCRGLAWLRIALSKANLNHESALQSAQEELSAAWEMGARDGAVAAALATIASQIGWSDKAEEWANKTLELETSPSDDYVMALEIVSELRFQKEDYAQSLDGFRKLVSVRRSARHWFYKGLNEQNLGKTDEAIVSMLKSVEINPKNVGAHTALAAIYKVNGNLEQQKYHQDMADQIFEALSN